MSNSKGSDREHGRVVRKENRHGVEKRHVQVDVGTAVLEVPARVQNPVTGRTEDLTNLSDDGYCQKFLALLAATNTHDHINIESAPVLTFDEDRFEYRKMDGQHVLVKREAETKFEEMVLGTPGNKTTDSSQSDSNS